MLFQGRYKQLNRFLLVGFFSVLIDLITYRIFLLFGIDVNLSKALGFIMGAFFAYTVNKNFTFESNRKGAFVVTKFVVIYLTSLIINIKSNSLILNLFDKSELFILIAFLIATILSAFFNFIGLKFVVFKE